MTRRPWRDRLRRSSVRIAAVLAIVLACGTAAAESVRIEIDGVDRAIADNDLARIRRQQSIDQFEDSALAGTAAPDKGQGLTLRDLEVEALKHRRAASLQPDSAEGDFGHLSGTRHGLRHLRRSR